MRIERALALITCVLLSGCGSDTDTPENPYLKHVKEAVSEIPSLRSKRFAVSNGWTVWAFHTDIGAKCVATKPVNQEELALPEAVFVRQTAGDLRLDVWLDDGVMVARVPSSDSYLSDSSRGYYRGPSDAFFHDVTFDELASREGKHVAIKPSVEFFTAHDDDPLDLTGINEAGRLVRSCDRSQPVR